MNLDHEEIDKFDALAADWWDPQGPCKPLHALNPLRLQFIEEQIPLNGKNILDVGCGGGILSEGMARLGGRVTGLDLATQLIEIAREHAKQADLNLEYQLGTIEELVKTHAGTYDMVTCLEMLEHVPEPAHVVQACATLLKPGGKVFFSTLNRNLKSYLFAIVGAEYLLRLLPKGTHDYKNFIRPAELSQWARSANLSVKKIQGIRYNPLTETFKLSGDVSVNYLLYCEKS